jgi:hypothetical protein
MSSPSGRWSISFASPRDWDDGKRSSGSLVFWSSKNWLVILNDHDDPLVGRSLEKGETIHVGSLVHFNSHIAKVQDCVFSPWLPKEPAPLRWNALCSSFVKGDWSSQHPATLLLRPLANRLVLLDGDGTLIDARFLLEGELIYSGVAFEMPVHKVIVGNFFEDIATSKQDKQAQVKQDQAIATKVSHPSLNIDRGTNFESIIKKKFGHSVNFVPGFRRREFLLVVSFGRASFKLNIHTVGLALQSCFGGLASKFHVKFLSERVFRFLVASRSVGFEMYNTDKFSESEFEFFIHLWGNGGPN